MMMIERLIGRAEVRIEREAKGYIKFDMITRDGIKTRYCVTAEGNITIVGERGGEARIRTIVRESGPTIALAVMVAEEVAAEVEDLRKGKRYGGR